MLEHSRIFLGFSASTQDPLAYDLTGNEKLATNLMANRTLAMWISSLSFLSAARAF